MLGGKKEELIDLLGKQAIETVADSGPADPEPPDIDPPKPKPSNGLKIIYGAYVISILLTTIEIPDLNVVSSISATLCLFLLLCFSFKQYILHPMVWLLLIMSVASGFSGPLLDTRQADNKALCVSIISSTECVEQTIEGLYILGIPTKDISRMAAVKAGKLNRLDFNDYVRGYGLISLARVTVIGS